MKKLLRVIKYPASVLVGAGLSYFLISYPLDSDRLPIYLYWLPDIIGWTPFFILLGFFAGLLTFGLLSYGSISEEEKQKDKNREKANMSYFGRFFRLFAIGKARTIALILLRYILEHSKEHMLYMNHRPDQSSHLKQLQDTAKLDLFCTELLTLIQTKQRKQIL